MQCTACFKGTLDRNQGMVHHVIYIYIYLPYIHTYIHTHSQISPKFITEDKRRKKIRNATAWTILGLNPGRGKDFPLLQYVKTGSVTHPSSYSVGTGVFAGCKAAAP
jgi:hypothetical protein